MSEVAVADSPASPSPLARLWRLPLGIHGLVLGLVLAAGLVLAGPRVAFSSDEGAAVLQAHLLRSGDGWLYRYPLAGLDAEDQARPFVRGDAGSEGVAPYAKHPLYPVILAGLDGVGGTWAIWAGGAAATLLAAWLAALLVRRVDARFDRAVLWLVGLASPLLFDSYFVVAHTMAAAAVAAGGLAAVAALRPGLTRARRTGAVVALIVAWMTASMLRTEALFVGPAFALAAAGLVLARRVALRRAAVAALAGVAASVVAWGTDHAVAHAIIGTARPVPPNVAPASWLDGRWQAFHTTWLLPSYSSSSSRDLALVLGLVLVIAAAALLHRKDAPTVLINGALVGSMVCYAAAVFVGHPSPIPGLAVAFPAGLFLLVASGRRIASGLAAPILAVTAGVVTVVVLLTQYAIGGGVEWGGRYFAIVVPLAVPALVFAAAPTIRRHGSDVARLTVIALVVVSLSTSVMAIASLRHAHVVTAAALDSIDAAADVAGSSGGFDRPIVVSSNRLLPQIDYRDFDRFEWVVPDPDLLGRYGDRLAAAGVDQVVLVPTDLKSDLAQLDGWHVERELGGPLGVVVLQRDS